MTVAKADKIAIETPDIDLSGAAANVPFANIAHRVFNTPLLLHRGKAEVIGSVLAGRLGIAIAAPEPSASRFVGKRKGATSYQLEGSTAIIGVHESLVNRGAWVGASSGLTSYEGITARLREAASDKEVERIILDLDSPGGEAAGMLALADQVRTIRERKPVVAVVNDMAASGAYGIASQASRIVVSDTALTGSIGVALIHVDYSEELKQRGLAVTLIYAGEHKVDGHPFGPLPDSVKDDLKREVAALYEQFVAKVAQGRATLSAETALPPASPMRSARSSMFSKVAPPFCPARCADFPPQRRKGNSRCPNKTRPRPSLRASRKASTTRPWPRR
jgi:signal peptide peptidase SppA